MRRYVLTAMLLAAPAAAEIGQPASEYERTSIPEEVERDIVSELTTSGDEPTTPEQARSMAALLRSIHGPDAVILASRFRENADTIDFRLLNPTDHFVWNITITVGQRESTYDPTGLGLATTQGEMQETTIHVPYLPPGYAVGVSVPVTIPRRYGANQNISVEHDSYLNASRLDAETVTALLAQIADASVGPTNIQPGSPSGTLAAQALGELSFDEPLRQLVTAMASTPQGREGLAAFVRDNPTHSNAGIVLAGVYSRDRNAFADLVRGIAQNEEATAIAIGALEGRTYDAAVQTLGADPTTRPSLWSLLARCEDRDRYDALARQIHDEDIADVGVALWHHPPGYGSEPALAEEKALLVARATALAHQNPEIASRLAEAAAQASLAGGLQPSFTSQAAELREAAPDAYVAPYRTSLGEASLPFTVEALESHGIDLVAFWEGRDRLAGCTNDISALRACADIIQADHQLLAVANESHVTAAFAMAAQNTLQHTTPSESTEVALRYRAWGMDTGSLVTYFCQQATNARMYRGGYGYGSEDPETWVDHARELEPGAACVEELDSTLAAEGRTLVLKRVAQAFLFVLPLAGVAFFGQRSLKKLRAERAKTVAGEQGQSLAPGRAEKHLGAGEWSRSFAAALDDARQRHEEDDTPEAKKAAAALQRARELGATDHAHELAGRALNEAKVASVVLTQGDLAVYVVALPGMTDHPQTLPRYPAFRRGFAAHVEEMRAAVERGGGPKNLLAIALFVRIDASEAALQVAYLEPDGGILPRYLLRDDEPVPEGVELLTHRFTFRTAGEAAA